MQNKTRPRQGFLRLKALKASFDQLSIKVMELIVISKIVMEKLDISHEQITEELTRLTNRDPNPVEGGSLEPEEAGADGDHQ
jgi:hypothetical protein